MPQIPHPATNADWQRVQELFLAALDRPEPEREAWLASQADAEDWVRDEVRSLLLSLRRHEELSR